MCNSLKTMLIKKLKLNGNGFEMRDLCCIIYTLCWVIYTTPALFFSLLLISF